MRRIMRDRNERVHPGDWLVFWFSVVGFIVLFVLGLFNET